MSDRGDLADFVEGTRDILNQVVEWQALLFREELREPISEAWQELRPSFEGVLNGLVGEGEARVPDEALQSVGLTGKQLKLKLLRFKSAWDRFKERGGVKFLKKLLDVIDIILESLGTLIPGADAIAEFKDSAKQGMEEAEEI